MVKGLRFPASKTGFCLVKGAAFGFLTLLARLFLMHTRKTTSGSRQGVRLYRHKKIATMARFSVWHVTLLLWAVLCAGVSAALDSDLDCEVASVVVIGDGRCDEEYNTQACGFDGGDCCECTCWENGESSIATRGVSVMKLSQVITLRQSCPKKYVCLLYTSPSPRD